MKYKLTGASQSGIYKDGTEVKIKHGDIIIPIDPASFWRSLKSFITGYRWYCFDNSSDRLFLIHDSIIDRYFEGV